MQQQIVAVQEPEPGILEITMQDRETRNAFSPQLANALTEAFQVVDRHTRACVVILKGYENYFSSGGSQDALLDIFEGKMQFTDSNLYSLPLECRIPVISAMQGHAIGGGFVFGLFSDFVVLAKESVYTTNFMKYGFTPGMGATCVLPRKLGIALAEEMLFSAATYRGGDLEKRGIPFPVLPRAEVLPHVMQMARQIAEKPRLSLIALKDHLVAPLRQELPAAIHAEVTMHEKTFHQPEVKQRILTLFGK